MVVRRRPRRDIRRLFSVLTASAIIASGCAGVTPSASPDSLPSAPVVTPGASATTSATAGTSTTPTLAPTVSPGIVLVPANAPPGFKPTITCSGSIGATDSVAIVAISVGDGAVDYVLRDYADVAHPRTACTFTDPEAELLDARHALVHGCSPEGGNCASAIVDLPEARYHWFEPPGHDGRWWTIVAIAPDLRAIAWVDRDDSTGERRLRLRDGTGEYTVFQLPSNDGGCGVSAPTTTAAFSRGGGHLYVLDTVEGARLYVVTGHEVAFSIEPPAGGWPENGDVPRRPLWSPASENLLYRLGDDVHGWSPDLGARMRAQDVPWLDATFSPGGRQLAYSVGSADGGIDVYLADPARLSDARRIGRHRVRPVFLNAEQLWYMSDLAPDCVGSPPKYLVYNTRTGTEAPSIIRSVISVWPATVTK